jgi:hypothetical protein
MVHEHTDFTILGRATGIYRRLTREHTEAIATGSH